MSIDLVVNREFYEEIYPSESDDSHDDDDDLSDSEHGSEAMKIFSKETDRIQSLIREAYNEQASANTRLKILDNYGANFAITRPNNLTASLAGYKEERKMIFQDFAASMAKVEDLVDEQCELNKEYRYAQKWAEKSRKKAERARLRVSTKKRLALQEKAQAKRRLKEEREYFWPKKVHRVVLSLDTNFDNTPSVSRRDSIDSVAKSAPPFSPNADSMSIAQDSCQIGLSISYITQCAWWSPRYDLSLTTTTESGMITYRAEFCNKTSETWRDAKVILSTSQTAFQDLGEAIPILEPWHICLARGFGQSGMDGPLLCRSEIQHNQKEETAKFNKLQESRSVLFGLAKGNNLSKPYNSSQPPPATASMGLQGSHMAQKTSKILQQTAFGSIVPSKNIESGIDSSESRHRMSSATGKAEDDDAEDDEYGLDILTLVPHDPTIEFEQSNWEETGLTTTYDVPGVRTIPPCQTKRRHKIASIALKNVQLSYVIIPKLREAAFLKARLHNNSSITLLKGPVGLTLDGSFLGNTTIPRCSAGDAFNLNLGVDPGITVKYQKPAVRKNQVGVFQKEESCIFARSLMITNTKANGVLEGVVLDQVPVSEDEKLKVEILQPRGFRNEGDKVVSGTAVTGKMVKNERSGGSVSSADRTRGVQGAENTWGRAVATLKKAGEICWNLKLNPGQCVRLDLEYEARFPGSERIIEK